MKHLKFLLGFALFGMLVFTSCEKEEQSELLDTSSSTKTEESLHIKGYGDIVEGKEYSVESFKGTDIYQILKSDESSDEKSNSGNEWRIVVDRYAGTGYYVYYMPLYYSYLENENGPSSPGAGVHGGLIHPNVEPDCDWTTGVKIRQLNNGTFYAGRVSLVRVYNNGNTCAFVASTFVGRINSGQSRYFKYKQNCPSAGSWSIKEY